MGPLPVDMDMRARRWRGAVTWGPNQFEATISESSIEAYHLYVVNDRLQKLGENLAVVEAKLWANLFNTSTCDRHYYVANLDLELPAGAAFFMVVPLTKGGLEMNIGTISERIEDVFAIATTSDAWCAGPSSSFIAWVLPFLVWSIGSAARV